MTSIGWGAFYDCSSLTSIIIPNSVTSIDDSAFGHCKSLTSITIPNSITTIGNDLFSNCSGLTSVTIPNSVTSIGWSAFYCCSSLTSIFIPDSVTSIGENAFYGCTDLTSVTLNSDVIISANRDYNSSMKNIFGEQVQTYTLGDAVKSIGDYALYGCSGLTSITIPNSVTSIGCAAFGECTRLTSINVPQSVTTIGNSAFASCSRLTSVTIPNSVTNIGDGAFSGCSSLTTITIPNSVTSIGEYTFFDCTSLTTVSIGSSVISISKWAFHDCRKLNFVKVERETPIEIDEGSFRYRTNAILQIPLGSKTAYEAANYWKEFKQIVEYIEGDVNVDELVNVVDVVDIARFVVGIPANTFVEILADINKDGSVNIGDAVTLVNDIAGDQNFVKAWNAPGCYTANDLLSLTEHGDCLLLNLDNERSYTAFQFDLYVPEDADVNKMMLDAARKQRHQLLYNKVGEGHYRVAALSTSNNAFNGNDGTLLSIALTGSDNSEVSIRNIHFFDAQGKDYLLEDIEGAITTSLTPTLSKGEGDIYDLQGRKREKLQRGVNISGGKKILF